MTTNPIDTALEITEKVNPHIHSILSQSPEYLDMLRHLTPKMEELSRIADALLANPHPTTEESMLGLAASFEVQGLYFTQACLIVRLAFTQPPPPLPVNRAARQRRDNLN